MKKLYAIQEEKSMKPMAYAIGFLTLTIPTIAFASSGDFVIKTAGDIIINFFKSNLMPNGRPVALSLLFVAMTSAWLFSNRPGRTFATIFGPIGLFFTIFNWAVGMGVTGWMKFLWNIIWSGDILTGIVLLLVVVYLLQNMAMKLPGYIFGSILRTVNKTKELAKDVNAPGEKKKEPWAWIVVGGIVLIGFIIKPNYNEQNNYVPLIASGTMCAFTVFSLIYKKQVGRWPWQKAGAIQPENPPTIQEGMVTCQCGFSQPAGDPCCGNCGSSLGGMTQSNPPQGGQTPPPAKKDRMAAFNCR